MTKPITSPDLLAEDALQRVAMIESVHYGDVELVEEASTEGKPKRFVIRGEFGRADRATENKRYYGRQLVEREIKKLSGGIDKRMVYGELDHPKDGRTSLNRVSHLITKLELRPDGVVYGEAVILPTERGKNLQAILSAGGRVGVSSRGFGSVKPNSKGESVVQEDFRLVTYDVVADPADRDAWPESFQENRGNLDMAEIDNLTEDEFRTRYPDLYEALEAKHTMELREENARLESEKAALQVQIFEAKEAGRSSAVEEAADKTAQMIAEAKRSIEERVRGEYLSDPKVARALRFIDEMKENLRPFMLPSDAEAVVTQKDEEIARLRHQVIERDETISRLQTENDSLEKMARTAGYRFFLERKLSGDPNADLIKQIVGDVGAFPDSDAIASRVEAIRAELQAREEARVAEEARRAAEIEKVREEERQRAAQLEAELTATRQKLQHTAALARNLALDEHIAKRLQHHPQRRAILERFEKSPPRNKAEAEEVIESFRRPSLDEESQADIRARVRGMLHSSDARLSDDPLAEVRYSPPPADPVVIDDFETPVSAGDYNGTGLRLEEALRLSGVGPHG